MGWDGRGLGFTRSTFRVWAWDVVPELKLYFMALK